MNLCVDMNMFNRKNCINALTYLDIFIYLKSPKGVFNDITKSCCIKLQNYIVCCKVQYIFVISGKLLLASYQLHKPGQFLAFL